MTKIAVPLAWLVSFLIIAVTLALGHPPSRAPKRFANQYLTITIRPGWRMEKTDDQVLRLKSGKYVLAINPMFTHASGVECGRFQELTQDMPSVQAVMQNVDQSAGGWGECSSSSSDNVVVNKTIALWNLYTDNSKSGHDCVFPARHQSVWFGSAFCGEASESEYAITLYYDSTEVNSLPERNSPELKHIFRDTIAMLRTLSLKPPLAISKISPQSALPGSTVTVYGSGFNIADSSVSVFFKNFPNNVMRPPVVADDGTSLTFEVPTSLNTISCPPGRVFNDEWCVPIPEKQPDIEECPQTAEGKTNFCGVPMPPGTYQVAVTFGGSGIISNYVPLTVSASHPAPVSISLAYPNSLVSVGETIMLHGNGFTPRGNTVRIGSARVSDISSPDGKTLSFRAPNPAGTSLFEGLRTYEMSVSNTNGKSNSIIFDYR